MSSSLRVVICVRDFPGNCTKFRAGLSSRVNTECSLDRGWIKDVERVKGDKNLFCVFSPFNNFLQVLTAPRRHECFEVTRDVQVSWIQFSLIYHNKCDCILNLLVKERIRLQFPALMPDVPYQGERRKLFLDILSAKTESYRRHILSSFRVSAIIYSFVCWSTVYDFLSLKHTIIFFTTYIDWNHDKYLYVLWRFSWY